jgi:hypothetical protein
MKELEETKFCRIYRMPKVRPNDAFRKTGNFLYKGFILISIYMLDSFHLIQDI